MITNFKFRIFIINLYTKHKISTCLYINKLHFDWPMIYINVFINYSIHFINIHDYSYCSHAIVNLVFQGSNKFLSNNIFSFIYFLQKFFISFSCYHDLSDPLWNFLPLSAHILFCLRPDLSTFFWKTLVTVIPFLPFKGNINYWKYQ